MEVKIYKALAAINKGVKAIEKNRKNQQQGFQFRGIDDVMNELHTLFSENGVFILPEVTNTETVERTTTKGGVLFDVKATVKFTFMADDGSSVSSTIVGEAMDSGDKATNKAMSIALKYALLQMFLIPTVEDKDPDAQTHEIKPEVNSELNEALFKIETADSLTILTKIYEGYPKLRDNKDFMKALKDSKVKFLKPITNENKRIISKSE